HIFYHAAAGIVARTFLEQWVRSPDYVRSQLSYTPMIYLPLSCSTDKMYINRFCPVCQQEIFKIPKKFLPLQSPLPTPSPAPAQAKGRYRATCFP
ncbi:MAG: hypothetical protein K2P04_10440, partial [Oscillospiraceae bacterium]|nr:hypothetical protein [Oscillospiraceae bacterium]